MKKALRIIFPFLILGILTVLFFGIRNILKAKKQVEQATATLPAEKYYVLDSTTIHTTKNLKNNAVFIFFFNSDCEYCQSEAKLLNENREAFKNATVYLFSSEPLENIRAFKEKYLPGNTDFIIGQVDLRASSEVFGVKSFPYTLIYDKNNRLVKTYKGIVKLEALTKWIE
jgi:thiol-disulfide isomerase/thioredoxin